MRTLRQLKAVRFFMHFIDIVKENLTTLKKSIEIISLYFYYVESNKE